MDMLIKSLLTAQSGFAACGKHGCRIKQNQLFAPDLFPFGPDRRIDSRIGAKWQRVRVARPLQMRSRRRCIRQLQQALAPTVLQLRKMRIRFRCPLEKLPGFRLPPLFGCRQSLPK